MKDKKPDPTRIYVAAHDTPLGGHKVHPWADYICDGVDDEVEINAAIEEAAPLAAILLEGTFFPKGTIFGMDHLSLEGSIILE